MSDMQTIYQVKVASTNLFVEVDTSKIDDFNMGQVIQKGLNETVGKRSAAKAGKASQHSSVEVWAEAKQAIAIEQRDALYAGKFRWVGAKGARKESDVRNKEALRHAKIDGDNMLVANGYVLSKVSMKDRVRVAEAKFASNPEHYLQLADASIAAAALGSKDTSGINLADFVSEDAKRKPRGKAALKATTAPAKPVIVPPPMKAKLGAHLRQ